MKRYTLASESPYEIAVLARGNDGSALIEIPIFRAGSFELPGLDEPLRISRDDLETIAKNVREFPGPIPVSTHPHPSEDERGTAAFAFLEAARVEDELLIGRIWLAPWFAEEVLSGLWRGFSVELRKDLRHPAKNLEGWAITGGVFTNRPAAGIEFKPADSAAAAASAVFSYELRARSPARSEGDKSMPEKNVVELNAKLAAAEKRAAELSAELESVRETLGKKDATIAELTAKVEELGSSMASLAKKFEAASHEAENDRIALAVEKALSEGVPASVVEGYSEAEDKVAWCRDSFGSFANLSKILDRIPRRDLGRPTYSGNAPGRASASDDPQVAFIAKAERLCAEDPKLSFSDAIDRLRETEPELYAAFAAAREG